MKTRFGMLVVVFTLGSICLAQSNWASVCDIRKNPAAFDGKQVTVSGFVELEFENFSLHSKDCDYFPGFWLMYGGDESTPTPSTWNDNQRMPGRDIRFKGKQFGLVKNQKLEYFKSSIGSRGQHDRNPRLFVVVTLRGTFFAAKSFTDGSGRTYLSGFGHMGCCHLFIIEEVMSLDAKPFARSLRGTAVDGSGVPLQGVEVAGIEGIMEPARHIITDKNGQFLIEGAVRDIQLLRADLQPTWIRTWPDMTEVKTTLPDSAATDWYPPRCADPKSKEWDVGPISIVDGHPTRVKDGRQVYWSLEFQLPEVKPYSEKMHAADELRITPEVVQEFNAGDSFYWQLSPNSSSRWIKDPQGTTLGLDESGTWENGTHWRSVTIKHGGTIFYRTQSSAALAHFEEILNSICLH